MNECLIHCLLFNYDGIAIADVDFIFYSQDLK